MRQAMGAVMTRIAFILSLIVIMHYEGISDLEETEKAKGEFLQKKMIWLESAKPGEQAYVVFRKELNIRNSISNAELRIFADIRYILWINGKYVERGPCRFDPKHPEYDILAVDKYLVQGKNAIAILVHHYAINSFSFWHDKNARMIGHEPGLTAFLSVKYKNNNSEHFITGTDWKGSSKTRFLPSPGSYSSVPDRIDARMDHGDWTKVDYDDTSWENACAVNGSKWGKLSTRSIPLLREKVVSPLKHRPLPHQMTKGDILNIDVGKVVQAYSVLNFDAEAGSKIEIRYFTLNGVSISFTKTMFNSYIAKDGSQSYMSGDTFGFRYMEIKVVEGSLVLKGIEIVDRKYPTERLGYFSCNDTLLNRLWSVCVNTVEVCSEDALVDCADRERAQWIADGYKMNYPVSRSALATKSIEGSYYYADARLLKNMLRHIALSQLSDGRIQPMRPSDYKAEDRHGVIDDYSCLFIQALREYYDRTSDSIFVEEMMPFANKTIDYFTKRITLNGLIYAGEFVYFDNPLINVRCEGATINAFIYGSLLDIAYLSGKLNLFAQKSSYEKLASDLYTKYNRLLWNGVSYYSALIDKDVTDLHDNPQSFSEPYRGTLLDGRFSSPTPHAALMALYYNLVPSDKRPHVLKYLLKCCDEKQVWWPYTSRFYLDLLYREDCSDLDQIALDYMRDSFGHMVGYETKTTSEDWDGGSFVHESGSHPAYFMSSFVLGVRTETSEEGLQLIIQPRLGDLMDAEGKVLSEFGEVSVKWGKLANGNFVFKFSIPENANAWVYLPISSQHVPKELTINSQKYINQGNCSNWGKIEGRYYKIHLANGNYSGEIIM